MHELKELLTIFFRVMGEEAFKAIVFRTKAASE